MKYLFSDIIILLFLFGTDFCVLFKCFFQKKLDSAYKLSETAKLNNFRKRNISLANFSDSKKTKTIQNKNLKYRQKNIVWF